VRGRRCPRYNNDPDQEFELYFMLYDTRSHGNNKAISDQGSRREAREEDGGGLESRLGRVVPLQGAAAEFVNRG
jgi:hypothetical protein